MVIMVLDHVRDFSFRGTFHFQPTDLTQTTVPIFFTRWVTHFCAPVFVFLAGTGAYLQLARGKSREDLSRFLVTRGVWLILLEFTVVRTGYIFSLNFRILGAAQVIWVIGVGMILLGGLIWLPVAVTGAVGVLMIAFHNTLDRFPVYHWHGPGSPDPTWGQAVWALLHADFGALPLGHPYPIVLAAYAIIPWVGVMAAGYAFGTVYRLGSEARRRALWWLGGTLCAAFIIIRAINHYGDPHPWSLQPLARYTPLSFLNTTKYPPSLDFLLMTLGPAILALAWFDGRPRSALAGPLITFGRVPLVFYLLQWYVARLLTVALALAAHQDPSWLLSTPSGSPGPAGDIGFRLRTTYLLWLASIAVLYPLCRWYAGVKQRRHDWWLSYL